MNSVRRLSGSSSRGEPKRPQATLNAILGAARRGVSGLLSSGIRSTHSRCCFPHRTVPVPALTESMACMATSRVSAPVLSLGWFRRGSTSFETLIRHQKDALADDFACFRPEWTSNK